MKEPTAGDRIEDRYILIREIAQGASGTVYEAEHLITRRPVAIKIMYAVDARNTEKRARLLLEARALVLARQPNVVQVLDAGLIEQLVPYVVMELLEGRTLAGLLVGRGRLEASNVVHIGRQLALALARIHGCGLIHRDIKPSNLFIARNSVGQEVVQVIDFGIVRVRDGDDKPRRLTKEGAILGTPEYMAPEQLFGDRPDDPRSDVYSAGVTLYECLTGRVPFEGTFGEILYQLSTTQAPPISQHVPEVPRALALIVEKAMASEPENRFTTAREFCDALTGLALQQRSAPLLLGIEDPQAGPEVKQRRRFHRVPYLTPVRTTRNDGSHVDGRSEDISEAGLLVVLPRPLTGNEQIEVRFALPMSGRIVTTKAKACWMRSSRTGVAVGLELQLDDEDRATIGHYVTTLRRDSLQSGGGC